MQPTPESNLLDMTSYCRYEYDDHLCYMDRPSRKFLAEFDEGAVGSTRMSSNGYATIAHSEPCRIQTETSPSLPQGMSTPPPTSQNKPLLAGRCYREVHYPGDMSLSFIKPMINSSRSLSAMGTHPDHGDYIQGHTTLPANKKAVLISCGPKSPLGKRSKSVTFSQPVAMVTPLNSESEESVEKFKVSKYNEESSYDDLNQLDIPDNPIHPADEEMVKILRWDHEDNSARPRPLCSFQSGPGVRPETKVLIANPFAPDDMTCMTDSWSQARENEHPLLLPRSQRAELFETGV